MNNNQIIECFNKVGVQKTQDINQAIYILSDGRMISGMFDCGVRGTDHRIVENIFDDIDREHQDFWIEVIDRTNMLMYIPETKVALKKRRQKLTPSQIDILKNHQVKLEEF